MTISSIKRTTGQYVATSVFGAEAVQAFVPMALPPQPALVIDDHLRDLLDRAHLAIGRLDSVTSLLTNPDFFLYFYIRKEAVLSSQIEGTQSSLSDLLAFEHEASPGILIDDVTEVSNYVAALEQSMARIREGFPITSRVLREAHAILMRGSRGASKEPGEFRRSQNWIGGSRPGNAHFVPPPPYELGVCMSDLEKFIHDQPQKTPTLIKAALAHVQFETIHPFLDGNGRVGRLLIILLLCREKLLSQPLLYLSLYFKENRQEYYQRLDSIRTAGDWEGWVAFFCKAVIASAESAVSTVKKLADLYVRDRDYIRQKISGRPLGSTMQIYEVLRAHPVCPSQKLAALSGLSPATVNQALQRLIDLQIVRELTGRQRNRLFGYDRYVAILNEGTERPF